ncbi:MAG: hypothetical protein M1816_002545 [Peltula sp. TS41687]|nr:MAG: hypothetical protein M1816_002545 [Peltula sp. TS41687]
MANVVASSPQPDFNLVSQGLQLASSELAKCPNIPALQQGQSILDAIQRLSDTLNQARRETRESFREVGERLGRIDSRLDALETRVSTLDSRVSTLTSRVVAAERNAVARLHNRMLHSVDEELRPLYDTQNRPINQFPRTPRLLEAMRGAILNTVLEALGESTDGSIDQRRLTVRLLIGLRTDVP